MAVNFQEFIANAESLLANHQSEIELRSCASRAYYGAYHCALGYADEFRSVPVSEIVGPSHEKLRVFFTSEEASHPQHLTRRSVGYMLLQAHRSRCQADYDLESAFSAPAADAQLISCQKLISKIGSLRERVS